ncbi:hypothetical protein [Rhodococcus sp. NPDC058514]|uniref:hypothetical protein n=1 Tax=unclassified Rhodococcus (in: high G+C Gram-positive bacteria) TaxID=192944 RepID=UPI00364FB12A
MTSAVAGGYVTEAWAYVNRYRQTRDPGLTAQLELAINNALHPNGGNHGAIVNPRAWTLTTIQTLQVCFESCTVLDEIKVEYNGSLYTRGEALFWGRISSENGKKFTIQNHSCEVYRDVPALPDYQAGFYKECGTAINTTSYNILDGVSTSFTPNANFYWRINLVLVPGEGNSPAQLHLPKSIWYESQNWWSDGSRYASFI